MRARFRAVVAVATAGCMLALAVPALANAPDPTSTKVDQVIVNPDGSRTVTVQGTWSWPASSEKDCPADRNGVGYQVDWFDNTANPVGKSNSPAGVLFVGDAQDNIVHSLETLGGSNNPGDAFFNGVPSSYLTHNTTDSTPSKTDASNWVSNCGTTSPSGSSGTWGPITHTYAAGFTGTIKLCPIMYDPHGTAANKGGGGSGTGDLTAGGNGHNGDNSYEGNGTLPVGNICPVVKIPSLTTSASSASVFGGSVSDTATLTGSSGTGTITFKLYRVGANCSGTALYTKDVPTNGDGDYQSGGFAPSASGTYQWQATFSSSTVSGIVSSCSDPNEQSTVPHPNGHPKPGIQVLKLASVMCADLAPGVSQPSGITPCHGTWSKYTRGVPTLLVPSSGSYAIPVKYQIRVINTGKTPLTLTLSDPRCDPGTISGPVSVKGTLTGKTLSAGGRAYYTCTHTLTQNDPNTSVAGQPFTNTATVTGKPPSGVPVHGHSKVTVHRKPKPKARKFCRSVRTGKRIFYTGSKKPAACLPSKPPHHGHGFTG